MAAWVGDSTTMPENWSLTAYFVADSERLYVGFYITDPKSVIGTNPAGYDGDAFRICVDCTVTWATTWTLTAMTPWLTRRTFSTPSL